METLTNIPITLNGNYQQFVNKQAPPIVRHRFKKFVCCCRYLKDIASVLHEIQFVFLSLRIQTNTQLEHKLCEHQRI